MIKNFGTGKYFDAITFDLRKETVATTDAVKCEVFDAVDGTFITQSNNVIPASSLAVGVYSTETFEFPITPIGDNQELFFQLSRTGALDPNNCYAVDTNNTNDPDSDP